MAAVSTTWKWQTRAETAGTTFNVGNRHRRAAAGGEAGSAAATVHGARWMKMAALIREIAARRTHYAGADSTSLNVRTPTTALPGTVAAPCCRRLTFVIG